MKTLSAATDRPRREDIGDLIVLHLYGSQREMGRQHVELLGRPLARQAYEVQMADWRSLIAGFGPAARVADLTLPRLWGSLWRPFESSGAYRFIAGMADGLGVSAADGVRAFYGFLGSGTTTLVATRSATADGKALVAKNSDWSDRDGMRKPIVTYCHPTDGAMACVAAGWPLLPAPATTAVNEAGLALGINCFNADSVVGLGLPTWTVFLAIQRARTVDEALRIFAARKNHALSGFVTLADAAGDIAMVECTAADQAVFRPDGDWFAQSNYARTERMVPRDRGRSLDAFARRAAMEEAARPHVGGITPALAARILRDRSNSPYVNESVVANAAVLNSAIVHPASRTLWHSTTAQPLAPFGEMLPFSIGGDNGAERIPPDPALGTPEMERGASIVGRLRRAVSLFDAGEFEQAGAIWDRFADDREPLVEPRRLAWARARVHWSTGRLAEADDLLAALDLEDTPFDVRANALVARAHVLDRLGRRDEARTLYARARDYLADHEYNDGLIEPLMKRALDGLAAQTSGPLPSFPALQRVPP